MFACMNNREHSKVIDHIKGLIKTGALRSGDKLPTERELAETLAVGRYSIREAMRIMDAMGLIESRQGSGNYLITNIEKNLTETMDLMLLIKEVDYVQISQLRRAIELYAYGCAIQQFSNEQNEALSTIIEKMRTTTGTEKAQLDKQFHDEIIRGSGNTLIISIMESLSSVCNDLIEKVVTEAEPEVEKSLAKVHEELLKGLCSKDLDLGLKAIHRHYDIIDAEIRK